MNVNEINRLRQIGAYAFCIEEQQLREKGNSDRYPVSFPRDEADIPESDLIGLLTLTTKDLISNASLTVPQGDAFEIDFADPITLEKAQKEFKDLVEQHVEIHKEHGIGTISSPLRNYFFSSQPTFFSGVFKELTTPNRKGPGYEHYFGYDFSVTGINGSKVGFAPTPRAR